MYAKRSILRVRYLNDNSSLSRPHKIQKLVYRDGKIVYATMNMSRIIDPSTFTTTWDEKVKKLTIPKVTEKTTTEIIRVRFKDSRKSGNGLSRPTRIYKLTTGDVVEYKRYTPNKNFSSAIDLNDFITEWTNGNTPTPRPLRKYTNEQLLKRGYSLEDIHVIRGRKYSAKQVKVMRHALGGTKAISGKEARIILDEHGTLSNALRVKKPEVDAIKKRRLEAQKNITHMGKYTHGKSKPISKQPKAKQPKRKISKSAKKRLRRSGGF